MPDPISDATSTGRDKSREKHQLRAEMAARYQASPTDPDAAEQAAAILLAMPAYQAADVVALYAALSDELSARPIHLAVVQAGKRCLLPRVCSDGALEFAEAIRFEDLRPGRYGVLEPPTDAGVVPLSDADLVVVPGVAFDRLGGRLGRGGGHYDRALEAARSVHDETTSAEGLFVIGLARSNQLVDRVPREATDQLVDAIVTECELIAREPAGT